MRGIAFLLGVLLAAPAWAADVALTLSGTPTFNVSITATASDGYATYTDTQSYTGTADSGAASLLDDSCPLRSGTERCVLVTLTDAPSETLNFTLGGLAFALEVQQIDLTLRPGTVVPGSTVDGLVGGTMEFTADAGAPDVVVRSGSTPATWSVPVAVDELTTDEASTLIAQVHFRSVAGAPGVDVALVVTVTLGALTFN